MLLASTCAIDVILSELLQLLFYAGMRLRVGTTLGASETV